MEAVNRPYHVLSVGARTDESKILKELTIAFSSSFSTLCGRTLFVVLGVG